MSSHLSLVMLASIGLLWACAQSSGTPRRGSLEVSWSGADTGQLAAPAQASWCAAGKFLEIQALQGDTGVGLVVFPKESVEAGPYRVVSPIRAKSLRPAAAAALRWFDQTTIEAFQAESGQVVLQRGVDRLLSGRLNAWGALLPGNRRLRVEGTFRDLAVATASSGCPRLAPTPADDSGVH